MEERFNLGGGFVPASFKGGFAGVLGNGDVGGVQFAVADDADVRDVRDLLANQFEDRAAEIAGDADVGFGVFEALGEEGVVETMAAGGEAVDIAHVSSTASCDGQD